MTAEPSFFAHGVQPHGQPAGADRTGPVTHRQVAYQDRGTCGCGAKAIPGRHLCAACEHDATASPPPRPAGVMLPPPLEEPPNGRPLRDRLQGPYSRIARELAEVVLEMRAAGRDREADLVLGLRDLIGKGVARTVRALEEGGDHAGR